MPAWLDFDSCFEVDDQRIDSALAPVATVADALPREKVFALLDRMAEIAKPGQGAPRVLFVIARLASCDWIDGDIEVRLHASGQKTVIDLMVDDGMLQSRLRPSLEVAVPFQEFETALGRITEFIAPLQLFELVEGKEATLGVDNELEAVGPDDGERSIRHATAELSALGVSPPRRRPIPPRKQTDAFLGGEDGNRRPQRSQYPEEPALSAAVVVPPMAKPSPKPAIDRTPESSGRPADAPPPAEAHRNPKRSKSRTRPRSVPAGVAPANASRPRPPPVTCGPGEGSLPPSVVTRAKAPKVPAAPKRIPGAPQRPGRPEPKSTLGSAGVKITEDTDEVPATDVLDDEPTLREFAEPIANHLFPTVLPTSNELIDDDEPTLRRTLEDPDESG